jgi:hypothetical protein
MASASKNLFSFLATDNFCASGKNDCLLIGLGCHPTFEVAINKAVGEYSTMYLDHLMRPGWCADIEKKVTVAKRLPDFHHANSRDLRNIERFSNLCKSESQNSRNSLNQLTWKIEKLNSPLHFITFVKTQHPDLKRLEFGLAEPNSNEKESPLYHPIW